MVNYSNCPSVGPCHVYTARIKITESKLSSMEYWVHISKCGCVSGEGMSSIYLCTQKPTHYVCFWAAMVIHFMSFLPLSVTDGVCIMRFKKKKKLKKTSHTHTLTTLTKRPTPQCSAGHGQLWYEDIKIFINYWSFIHGKAHGRNIDLLLLSSLHYPEGSAPRPRLAQTLTFCFDK